MCSSCSENSIHKLIRAPVWVLCKFPQMLFSDRTTYCIGHVLAQKYFLICTYALEENCFLLRSRASDWVSRRLHLNFHKNVHVLCEKTSFASDMIVHRRPVVVTRFVEGYDDVPDGHSFLQLDRDTRHGETPFATRMTTDTLVRRLCASSTQYKL